MRGQVYDFNGLKVFTMSGAMSIDKDDREVGVSWWSDENISEADINEAHVNLAKHNFSVDIVITHTCPKNFVLNLLDTWNSRKFNDENMDILQKISDQISFKKWYFGH